MNRAMRRAESKQKKKDSQSLEPQLINYEPKTNNLPQDSMNLSQEEASLLMQENLLTQENQQQLLLQQPPQSKNRNRKNPQNPPIGGTEKLGEDKAPADRKGSYAKDIKDLASLYENLGGLISLKDPLTGLIIIQSAEERATELINVAKHHKKLLEVLRRIAKGGDYGACIMGHLSMVITILAVHGRAPIQFAVPTLEKLGINPMDIVSRLQEAQNGHDEAATASPV